MVTPDQAPADAEAALSTLDLVTSADQCITKPGYGFDGTYTLLCAPDTYSEGYSREDCVSCGDGLHTLDAGATSAADCLARAGWFKWQATDNVQHPCPVGSYSAMGSLKCTECPLGTTTEEEQSTTISQCNVCAPGFGFDAASSQCVICAEGSYAPGGSLDACTACGKGQTSRVGAKTAVDCFAEFVPFPSGSVVNTPDSAWTKVAVDATGAAAVAASCQANCHDKPRCQYWVVDSVGCSLKLAASNPAPDTYAAIKLTTDSYTIWEVSMVFSHVCTIDPAADRAVPGKPALTAAVLYCIDGHCCGQGLAAYCTWPFGTASVL